MKYRQQIFSFRQTHRFRLDDFIFGPNLFIQHQLSQLFVQDGLDKIFYLYGPAGSGKTHLLQALSYKAEQFKLSWFYWSLKDDITMIEHSFFRHLEGFSFIAFDDLDQIAGKQYYEELFFHFFNQVRLLHIPVIFASQYSANEISIQLPDLKSRLLSCLPLELKPLNDEEKLAVLQKICLQKRLEIDNDVLAYLIRHYPRSMLDLNQLIEKLDSLSLQEHQKITIPFIKKWLGTTA
jgi:DnaA family protein